MAYKIIANGEDVQNSVVEIVVDYRAEIGTLPTEYSAGSDAIVIEDSSVWMLGNDKTWHEI